MILFVFEGNKREPDLFRSIQRLYFPNKEEQIVCSYNNNIYQLYKDLEVSVLNAFPIFLYDYLK